MRLATVEIEGRVICVAGLPDGRLLDLAAAAAGDGEAAAAAVSMQALVAAGPAVHARLAALVATAGTDHCLPVEAARFLAPLPRPAKNVFCVGRNYAEHIAEGARAQNTTVAITEHPVYFTKPPTAVIGDGAEVPIFPQVSTCIDYEVELAVVMGAAGRDIPKARAHDHIFGYTILNDVTARDVQRRHGGQYFKGKGLDGSCPLGPWIVTADELADPQALTLKLWVNGELRQNGNTADMIFDIPTLIASLSEGLTLEPGDILATGTPSGVGYAMTPPCYLKDGDTVLCEIEGIGRLCNKVRAV